MIRVGLKLKVEDFDKLVEQMRAYPPMGRAEFYMAGIDCGNFTVDTIEEVKALAAQISGTAQKFEDAETEYASWSKGLRAVK